MPKMLGFSALSVSDFLKFLRHSASTRKIYGDIISYLQGRMGKCYCDCEEFNKSLFSLFTSNIMYVGQDELLKSG